MPAINLSPLGRRACSNMTPTMKLLIASTVILGAILVVVLWMYHVSRRDVRAALKEQGRLTKKLDKLQQKWKDAAAQFSQSHYDRLATLNEYEMENTRLRQALDRGRMRRGSQKMPASPARRESVPNNAVPPSSSHPESYQELAPHSVPLRGSDEQPLMPQPMIPPLLKMKTFRQDKEDVNTARNTKRNQETIQGDFSKPSTSPNEPKTFQEKLMKCDGGETIFPGPNHPMWPFNNNQSDISDQESGLLTSNDSTAS